MARYDRVVFRFLIEEKDENVSLVGSVVIRDNEMVLDIQDPNGASPYVISGRLIDDYYKGANAQRPDYDPVDAAWARVGNQYIGYWLEDGLDFLFAFELPQASPAEHDRVSR